MMADSRISSRASMRATILPSLRKRVFGMNIDSLTIWLLMLSNQMEDLFGPARTMMVTFNLILLLRAMDHWD